MAIREIDPAVTMMRRIASAAEKGHGVRLSQGEAEILADYFGAFILHNSCDKCKDRGRELTCRHPLGG